MCGRISASINTLQHKHLYNKNKSMCASANTKFGDISTFIDLLNISNVHVPACPFGRGQQIWAVAMLSQRGATATLEGTDGLNLLSPWFAIQINRKRNKDPNRRSTTEGNSIAEMEKKTFYKKEPSCFKVKKIPKIGSTKRQMLCQHCRVDERDRNR